MKEYVTIPNPLYLPHGILSELPDLKEVRDAKQRGGYIHLCVKTRFMRDGPRLKSDSYENDKWSFMGDEPMGHTVAYGCRYQVVKIDESISQEREDGVVHVRFEFTARPHKVNWWLRLVRYGWVRVVVDQRRNHAFSLPCSRTLDSLGLLLT